MPAFATSFILLIAGLSMQVSAITVGDCNVTYFISQGHICQRQMIINLQTNPDTNCSYEYGNEKNCMKNHIKSCLTGFLAGYVDPVTSLLLHQVYHCGDLEYTPSTANAFILKMIKCKQEAFMDTDFCWSYFRDRLNANRSDPLLCREYALAKECITEKAKANCKICLDLKRDTYNPFCPTKTDPELHVNGCQDLETPLSCTAYTTYKIAGYCEKRFLTAFLGKEKPNCGTAYTALRKCLDEQLSKTCQDYANDQRLQDNIKKAVTTVLRGRRFFCEPVSLRAIDLDIRVRPLFPCSAEFLPEMEKCAAPLRMDFRSPNNATGELCRNYNVAVDCSNTAQKSHCKFVENVGNIIQYPYGCQDLETPLSCTTYTTYKIAGYCEKRFLTAFLGKEKPNCRTAYNALSKCLDEQLSKTCQDYANDQLLQDNIKNAVTTVLRGHRFFCEPVSLRAIDLDIRVRPLFPCSAEFLPEMEKCAAPVRMDYRSPNNATGELCRNYNVAVECSNTAQKSHCKFDENVGNIIQYPYGMFCTDVIGGNNNRGRNGSSNTTYFSTALYFIICALVLQLL